MIRVAVAAAAYLVCACLLCATTRLYADDRTGQETEIRARLEAADKVFSSGEYPKALAELSLILRDATRIFGPRALITLHAHNDYAGTLYHMGRLVEARTEFETVLAAFSAPDGPGENNEIAFDAMNNYANVVGDLENAAKAIPLQRNVLARRVALLGENHIGSISALGDLAYSVGVAGDLLESQRLSERVLELRKKEQGPTHPWTFTAANNLAHILWQLGRTQEALALHEEVLAVRIKALGERHAETLVSKNNLATALHDLGRYTESYRLRTQALADQQRYLSKTHFETLNTKQGLIQNLISLQRYSEAEVNATSLLTERTQDAGQSDVHPAVIGTQLLLAEALEHREAFVEAANVLRKAAEKLESQRMHEQLAYLATMHALGRVLRKQGQCDNALAMQKALYINLIEKFGEYFFLTLATAHEQAQCLLLLDELNEAQHLYSRLSDTVSRLRAGLPSVDDIAQRRLMEQFDDINFQFATVQARLGNRLGALMTLEQRKAFVLLDNLEERRRVRFGGGKDADWERYQEQRATIRGIHLQMRAIERAEDRLPLVTRLSTLIDGTKELREKLLAAGDYVFQESSSSSSLQLLQVPGDTVALSFAISRNQHVVAGVALPTGSVDWVDFGQQSGIRSTIEAFRLWTANHGRRLPIGEDGTTWKIVRGERAGEPFWKAVRSAALRCAVATDTTSDCVPALATAVPFVPAHFEELRRYLYTRLYTPLREHFANKRHLLISPDGELGFLPWDALLGEPATTSTDPIISQAVSLLTAPTVLQTPDSAETNKVALDRIALFAVGNPQFLAPVGADRGRVVVAANTSREKKRTVRGNDGRDSGGKQGRVWPKLPATEVEMYRSAASFSAAQSVVLSGANATKSGLFAQENRDLLARADHVLFSTHAHFDPNNPHQSAIILGPDAATSAPYSELTLADLSSLKLSAQLAVLSACSTGRLDATHSEGLFGFAHALRLAGAARTLLTLWPVSDRVAAEFVSEFFARVARGVSYRDALAETKAHFRAHKNPQWRSPRNWAGYVLYE